MALGDGIRRNIRTVAPYERDRFKSALLTLLGKKAAGVRAEWPPAGLSSWFDQDELYQASHVHYGPEFLPWHREQCNRFEQLLRDVDPQLSLHYWDWNEDPHDLFAGGLPSGSHARRPRLAPADSEIVGATSFQHMRSLLDRKRTDAHAVYIGATLSRAHLSFRDPFVFPLHANVDRLFAMWQAQAGQGWRLDPGRVYGSEGGLMASLFIEPWSGRRWARPWAIGESTQPRTYVHPSLVAPPCYDTLPTRVTVDEGTNAGLVVNFNDVYSGKTFARAASFRILGCGNLTFEVTEGPTGPYSVITPGGAVTVAHSPTLYQEARLWFGFTGGTPDTNAPAGSVTIRCKETRQDFTFKLRANSIALPTSGVVLAIDRPLRPNRATKPEPAEVTWTWTWRPAAG
jgi:hypothetical protein